MDVLLIPIIASAVTTSIAQALGVRELRELVRVRREQEARERHTTGDEHTFE